MATVAKLHATVAKARPTSKPLTLARTGGADDRGAGPLGFPPTAGAETGAGAADLAACPAIPMDGAGPGVGDAVAVTPPWPVAARGAVGAAEDGGAPAAGRRIDGPPAGLGGSEMRTVCFFCAASAGFGGSGVAPGAPGGGVVSDINSRGVIP